MHSYRCTQTPLACMILQNRNALQLAVAHLLRVASSLCNGVNRWRHYPDGAAARQAGAQTRRADACDLSRAVKIRNINGICSVFTMQRSVFRAEPTLINSRLGKGRGSKIFARERNHFLDSPDLILKNPLPNVSYTWNFQTGRFRHGVTRIEQRLTLGIRIFM